MHYFVFPNLTKLSLISGEVAPPTKTWEIIKCQYNLRLIQEFPLRIIPFDTESSIYCSTVLRDAPMLRCLDKAVVASGEAIDDKTLGGISSGDLGHFLQKLSILCRSSHTEAILKMVEARQKAAAQRVERGGYNRQEVKLTSLKGVRITTWGKPPREKYKGRLGELERLGVYVEIDNCGVRKLSGLVETFG